MLYFFYCLIIFSCFILLYLRHNILHYFILTVFFFFLTVRRSKFRRNNGFRRNPWKFWIGFISGNSLCSYGSRAYVLKHITCKLRHYSEWSKIQVDILDFFIIIVSKFYQMNTYHKRKLKSLHSLLLEKVKLYFKINNKYYKYIIDALIACY